MVAGEAGGLSVGVASHTKNAVGVILGVAECGVQVVTRNVAYGGTGNRFNNVPVSVVVNGGEERPEVCSNGKPYL